MTAVTSNVLVKLYRWLVSRSNMAALTSDSSRHVLSVALAFSPCINVSNQKNTACDDAVCMRMITPERVLESIRGIFNGEENLRSDLVHVTMVALQTAD